MLQRELLAVAAASQTGYTPNALGSSLLAWWDADRSDLVTPSAGGAVTSWKDIAHAYDQTATSTASPTYSLTSFNGRPGLTFDGAANSLVIAGAVAWLPSGASGSEDWYLLDQTAPASDTSVRYFGAWGGSNGTARRAGGLGETTAYHTRSTTGNGASAITNTGTVEIFGKHVLRFVTEPTQTWVEVDGVAQAATVVTPATNTTTLRTGSNATPASFAQMILAARIITNPLTAAQADRLRAWLMRRR